MTSLYENLIDMVVKGNKVTVDLKKKNVRLNRKEVKFEGTIIDESLLREPFRVIETLYGNYKSSVPSKNDSKRHSYFKAKDVTELTDKEMIENEPRAVAQAKLELYVLFSAMLGALSLEGNQWFWQSDADKDLVILKEWL